MSSRPPTATIHGLLTASARETPHATAVEGPGSARLSHGELDALSDTLRDRLRHLGVRPGDRVGLYLDKSIDAIASIYGILKAGAAYVPVDPLAPALRNGTILGDCAVKAVVVRERYREPLTARFQALEFEPALLSLPDADEGDALGPELARLQDTDPAPGTPTHASALDDTAFILYTSGSTGRPKGVVLSHRNAGSFVDWCSETFEPRPDDRLSSHAPFHFDLSVHDVHVAIKHGATVVLIGEETAKSPKVLAAFAAERQLTVWYSAPSILALMARQGELESLDLSALRLVLFAGEVFPVKHLHALMELVPAPRYFNLYGPTETNVCTYHEIPRSIDPEHSEPHPIGKTCSNATSIVIGPTGEIIAPGNEGELCIRGPAVTSGYWNRPERTAEAFHHDEEGLAWYRTGDIVVEDQQGVHVFKGRRDRMVKKRGYRVELGEIEARLHDHADVREAAVLATTTVDGEVTIVAHLVMQGEGKPSTIALKAFLAERLPRYMVPDRLAFVNSLPRTSTGKVDYQRLAAGT